MKFIRGNKLAEAARDGRIYRRRSHWIKKVKKALQKHQEAKHDSIEWKRREQKFHEVLLRMQAPLWDILERRAD